MADPLRTKQRFYDSFYDPHLQNYFENKNVQKHLRKVGLINRHGEKLSPKEYQATINQRSRQEHIRALLSQGIVQKVIQLEKSREANIRNQFEFEAKKLLVENVKESRHQYKELRSKDFLLLNRPQTSIVNKNQIPQEQMKIVDEFKISPSRISSMHPSRSPSRKIRHRSPSKINKPTINGKDRCEITMVYLGGQPNLDLNGNRVEIVIMQQHCGGQNLIVFKDFVKLNERFRFESRRHYEYPFALSLYVNGLIDSRISVCCEYKHKFGLPIGGKRGSFAILNVQGGKPCQTCRFNEYMTNTRSSQTKSSELDSVTYVQSETHPLLRTPSPHDKQDDETTTVNNEYDEAEQIYKNLLNKLNENANWKDIGYIHCQLGNICKEGLGDYEKALEHYLISLETLCQNLSALDIKLRNIYLNIAHILLLQGQIKNKLTIEYFQRILSIDNSSNNPNQYNLINDHNYLGLLYKNEENYSKALFHFNKSLQYQLLIDKSKQNVDENFFSNDYFLNETIYDKKALKSLSIDKLPNLSDIYFNLGTTYQNLGQKQNALKHVQKALQLANQDQKKFQIYQNYYIRLQQI